VTLDQLRALVAVAREGSLTKAAAALGTPRTTLKRRLGELEAHFQAPLVHRDAHGAVLTQQAQVIVERCQQLLLEADAIARDVRRSGVLGGSLLVRYPHGIAPEVWTAAIRTLRAHLPDITLVGTPGPIPDDPREVDIAFQFGGSPPEGPWLARAVRTMPIRLLASEAYLEAHGTPSTVEELREHVLMCWMLADGEPQPITLLDGTPADVSPVLRTPDVHSLHVSAKHGLGIAWVPDALVSDQEQRPLVHVLPDLVGSTTRLWLVRPQATRHVAMVRAAVAYFDTIVDAVLQSPAAGGPG
jgi:DNA-binding transcriptional LysR family regulator